MVAGPWWHSWSLRTSVSLFNPRSIIPLKGASREFPGGPVIEILPSNAGSSGSVPGRGTEILQAVAWPKNKQKKVTL